MVTPESIQSGIQAGLACERVEVVGDGQHFQALVVSPAFAGKSRIQRHQLVYAALGETTSAWKCCPSPTTSTRSHARPAWMPLWMLSGVTMVRS